MFREPAHRADAQRIGTPRTKSTLAERIVAGWLTSIPALAVTEVAGHDVVVIAAASAIGSGAGVILATAKREGARPLKVFAGAVGGGFLFMAALSEARRGEGITPGSLLLAVGGTFCAPLGAALMHTAGRRPKKQ